MSKIKDAWRFATEKHVWDNKQKYAHTWPYTHHLLDVVNVLKRFDILDEELYIAAILHDVVEDTRGKDNEVKSRDISENYGARVGKIVEAVTVEPGENRKIRNALTYPKILAAGWDALAVKLADRIANVEFGITGGGGLDMYQKEHEGFRRGVFMEADDPATDFQVKVLKMWHHLNHIIKDGNKYAGRPEHEQSRWEPR